MPDWTNLYGVYSDSYCNHLVMVAPKETIIAAFQLHEDAWKRVRHDMILGTSCHLHFNNRRYLDLNQIWVRQLPLVRL